MFTTLDVVRARGPLSGSGALPAPSILCPKTPKGLYFSSDCGPQAALGPPPASTLPAIYGRQPANECIVMNGQSSKSHSLHTELRESPICFTFSQTPCKTKTIFNVPNRNALDSGASDANALHLSVGRKSDGGRARKSSRNLCPFLFRFRSIFAPFNYTITFVPNYTLLLLLYTTLTGMALPTHFSPWALTARRGVWQLVLKREHGRPSSL